jgi:hypothetical protein
MRIIIAAFALAASTAIAAPGIAGCRTSRRRSVRSLCCGMLRCSPCSPTTARRVLHSSIRP